MVSLLKGLRRWWALRDPEIRWIVEVGVDEVPEEANPVPERMGPPYGFVVRTVDENSYLLDDPDIMLTVLAPPRRLGGRHSAFTASGARSSS
jgi:hypothetical protein